MHLSFEKHSYGLKKHVLVSQFTEFRNKSNRSCCAGLYQFNILNVWSSQALYIVLKFLIRLLTMFNSIYSPISDLDSFV